MKRMMVSLISLLLFLSLTPLNNYSATTQAQKTATLQASKDNILIESPTGELSSGKGPVIFVGRTGQSEGSIRRGLIAFDIAGSIPAGSKITSVKLTLNVTLAAGARQPAKVSMYKITADWGEGTSVSQQGRGVVATSGDATWIHTFYDKSLWSKPGGDYVTTASASQTVVDVGSYTWESTPGLVSDVQSWLNSPKSNYGWILIGDESQAATAKVFLSRESDNEAQRPKLTVTFTPSARKK
jgi:hypothetical protein